MSEAGWAPSTAYQSVNVEEILPTPKSNPLMEQNGDLEYLRVEQKLRAGSERV